MAEENQTVDAAEINLETDRLEKEQQPKPVDADQSTESSSSEEEDSGVEEEEEEEPYNPKEDLSIILARTNLRHFLKHGDRVRRGTEQFCFVEDLYDAIQHHNATHEVSYACSTHSFRAALELEGFQIMYSGITSSITGSARRTGLIVLGVGLEQEHDEDDDSVDDDEVNEMLDDIDSEEDDENEDEEEEEDEHDDEEEEEDDEDDDEEEEEDEEDEEERRMFERAFLKHLKKRQRKV